MPDSLYALALLACPLGMGAMMWMMMRSGHKEQPPAPQTSMTMTSVQRDELDGLRAEVEQLRSERAAHR